MNTDSASAKTRSAPISRSGEGMNRQRFFSSVFFLIAVLLAVWIAPLAYAQKAPQASVDRNVVSEGDSLTLIISVEGNADDSPNYAALKKDFEVFGNSQSTQHSLINGRISSHTEWQTTLVPKHSGQLTIPPLAVGSASTQAIVIQVNAASKTAANDGSEPIFIEVQTDRNSVYLQQQLLFSVRVFVSVQLEDMQLTKPEFDNASVKQLSENTFRREINGTPYAVYERTYAIFPQQPGELTIPELVFNAVEVTRSRSLFDFPGQGRALHRMSKQLNIHVKPIPKSFTGPVWLPARNLTLTESWSRDQQHLATGESITRSIAVRADGLLAAQLPALDAPTLDNAKIYPDQPTLDDQEDASGVHGKRVENMALIPTKAGALHLPETKVIWWDVDSDSEKVATLGAESINVAAGAVSTNPTAPIAAPTPQPQSAPTTATNDHTQLQTVAAAPATLWQIICAALLVLWLATLYLYWRSRRTIKTDEARPLSSGSQETSEDNAWRALTAACRGSEPAAARQALLAWARIAFKQPDLRSTDQLQQLCGDAALTRELQQLDNRLFGNRPDSSAWNGGILLEVVRKLKARRTEKPDSTVELPPLYPTR